MLELTFFLFFFFGCIIWLGPLICIKRLQLFFFFFFWVCIIWLGPLICIERLQLKGTWTMYYTIIVFQISPSHRPDGYIETLFPQHLQHFSQHTCQLLFRYYILLQKTHYISIFTSACLFTFLSFFFFFIYTFSTFLHPHIY